MKRTGIVLISLVLAFFGSAYADDTVQQGAQTYDWQNCMDAKVNDCLTDCSTSEDISCQSNCKTLARDKCLSEGYSQPSDY